MDCKKFENDFWEIFKKLPPLEKVKVYSRMKQINDFWERLHSVNPNKLYISQKTMKLCKMKDKME